MYPGGQYPPQQGQYPPQGGQYPPQSPQYPPQGGQYPPQQGGQYPPQSPQYPPQGGQYAPQSPQYPPGTDIYNSGGNMPYPPPTASPYPPGNDIYNSGGSLPYPPPTQSPQYPPGSDIYNSGGSLPYPPQAGAAGAYQTSPYITPPSNTNAPYATSTYSPQVNTNAPYATPAPYSPAPAIYTSGGSENFYQSGLPPLATPPVAVGGGRDIYASSPYATPGAPAPGPVSPYQSGLYGSNPTLPGGGDPNIRTQVIPWVGKVSTAPSKHFDIHRAMGSNATAPPPQPSQIKETGTTMAPITKASSGSSLVGKMFGQFTGQTKNMGAQVLSGLSRRVKNDDELVPPPGGFMATTFEYLTRSTLFNDLEIECLYYEFKRHTYIPDAKMASSTFEPIINIEQFGSLMPVATKLTNVANYQLVIKSLFEVFKFGTQQINFDAYAKVMNVIVRGTPHGKMPMLYCILMDPAQRRVTRNSVQFTLTIFSELELPNPSANNEKLTQHDITEFISGLFGSNHDVSEADFTHIAMSSLQYPQRCWRMLLDCFGLFPYFFYTFFYDDVEVMARNPSEAKVRPHKEGFLVKQYKATITANTWKRHWVVIENGFMWYYPKNNEYDEYSRVIYLGDAKVRKNCRDAGDPPYCLEVIGPIIRRKFAAESDEEMEHWYQCITASIMQGKNVNHSFSPVREGISGRWFADGVETYRLMEEAIESAKSEIYITDWFLSPQTYLTRYDAHGNPSLDDAHRLDTLLLKKANEGVMIYVLPWSETKIMPLDSANVKAVLESLHMNIRVLCHPLVYPFKWSHHQKNLIVDQRLAFVGGLDMCFGRWDTQEHSVIDNQQPYLYPGKDYYNPGIAGFANVKDPWTDILKREEQPRMPWHDVHMVCDGEAARDVAVNFIQRWNHHKEALSSHHYIVPTHQYLPKTGKLNVQVIRSICDWSAGSAVVEKSIYNAYMAEIEKAENFIYIENQFFISSLAGRPVENEIAHALLQKVLAAARLGRVFRIIVIVPVHPEGSIEEAPTRSIMGFQVKTVIYNSTSMTEQFQREFPNLDVTQYFHFYCVKNWARLNHRFVAEQIYVHSKLMIVDDRTVIVGSANINDRSMLGTRDSEIAVVIKDNDLIDSTMNGMPFKVARFAHELRCNLFTEHIGLDASDSRVKDPICQPTYDLWTNTARENAIIFNELFYKTRSCEGSPENEAKLRKIRGHLVDYDHDFLTREEMAHMSEMFLDDVMT